MSRFPTAGHLCSWAKFSPGLRSSAGKTKGTGSTGQGNRYLARILGEVAVTAAKTDTFLGARYRRIAKRRGKKRATVAVGRSILVVIWHLLSDGDAISPIWDPITSPNISTRNGRSTTTFASWRPSATPSPSPQPREPASRVTIIFGLGSHSQLRVAFPSCDELRLSYWLTTRTCWRLAAGGARLRDRRFRSAPVTSIVLSIGSSPLRGEVGEPVVETSRGPAQSVGNGSALADRPFRP